MPLVERPYPVFSFLNLRSNPLLYAARIVGGLAPLACAILIGIYAPTLMRQGDKAMIWKFALLFHCIHCIFNLFTISNAHLFILFGFSTFHALSLMSSITFMFNIMRNLTKIKISTLEASVAIFPYVGCSVWLILWGLVCYYRLRTLGYRHWLSTFDRDWRPEMTRWWWRPVGVRESVKRLRGHGSV